MGVFVRIDNVLADGLIHVRTLGDDYYQYNEIDASLTGERTGRTFRLGDRVNVDIARADWKQKQIDLVLSEDSPVDAVRGIKRKRRKQGMRGKVRPR